jgi:membrane protein YqaA with SNARE-associated domain
VQRLSRNRLRTVNPRHAANDAAYAAYNAAMSEISATTSLWALFTSSFLAATLLPGGSEAVLFGVLKLHPQQMWAALAVATLGNTLGGMSSYLIGRIIPQKQTLKGLAAVQRYGTPVLLLSWVPLIGDPLCVAAGWLRLSPWWSALCIAVGKFARYAVIAAWTASGT